MNEIATVNADRITSDCRTFVDGSTRCREEPMSVTIGRRVYMLGGVGRSMPGPNRDGIAETYRVGVVKANNSFDSRQSGSGPKP